MLAGGVSEGQGEHINCLPQFPTGGHFHLKHPHSFQETYAHSWKTRPSAAVLQHFPPVSLLVLLPTIQRNSFLQPVFVMLERKAGFGLSPTATTRQPSSQAGNIPWVFQMECLPVLTSPAQRYWLAEVYLCPWHCVPPDPTPNSTADCHRLHGVCRPPAEHSHTPYPRAPG